MSETTKHFIEAFFGPGNELSRESLPREGEDLLQRCVDSVQAGSASMLPRIVGDDTFWYAIPWSNRERADLLEDVRNVAGLPALRLRPGDPIDDAVARFTEKRGFRVRVPSARRGQFRVYLSRMMLLWESRPARTLQPPANTQELLHEFESAIALADWPLASTTIQHLASAGHVTAVNAAFLRVRLLAEQGAWIELAALPEWSDLVAIRRPSRVTDAMLRALFETHFRAHVGANVDQLLARFDELVAPAHAGLFRSAGGLKSSSALFLFALYALRSQPPDADLLETIKALWPQTDAALLGSLLPRFPARDRERTADEALSAGRFEEAFAIASGAEPSAARSSVLISAAIELQTVEAAASAVKSVRQLPEDERDGLLGSRMVQMAYEELTRLVGDAERPPTNWDEWLAGVISGAPSGDPRVQLQHAGEWNLPVLLSDSNRASRLADLLLESGSERANAQRRLGMPVLCAAIHALPPQDRVLAQSVLEAAFLQLATTTVPSLIECELLQMILAELTELAPSAEEYRSYLSGIAAVWSQRTASDRMTDWLIAALEMFCLGPRIDDDALRGLLTTVLAGLNWRRIDRVQWSGFADLAADLGVAELVPEYRERPAELESTVRDAAADIRVVGIYSLQEPAAHRAQRVIHEMYPGLRVEVNSELDASDRLRSLSRTADVMLIVVRAAKHAATEFIQAQRAHRLTISVGGTGSISIVRALEDALRQTRQTRAA